ncbi:hypothetical protein [Parasitella parasitica]|uniref:Uncharacterized protein n=1 Tax=Parasitella parasitica TaxID=35722 RepID=A0A0B7N399_9FUNG|nr:hypothetical protein [Parasitella parasitica]
MDNSIEKEYDYVVGIGSKIAANLFNKYTYIQALDFGTTYSSCCYAKVGNPSTVYSVKNWPRAAVKDEKIPSVIAYSGKHNTSTSIVPSAIAYTLTEQKSSIDVESKIKGFGNVPETSTSVLIKHLPFVLHIKDLEPAENDRNPAADFLKLLHQHVIEDIKVNQGEKGINRIRYCFTLQHPSQPRYKTNITKAIKQAGICKDDDREDKILFIDSYTAMAKHLLKTQNLKLDDRLIICDADSKYLKIKIVGVVSAGSDIDVKELEHNFTSDKLCSDQLNDLFENYILDVIKKHPIYTEDKLVRMKADALEYFEENIKYSLDLSIETQVPIKLLTFQSAKGAAPYLTLEMSDLKKKVYDPVIDEVCKLVSEQCRSASRDYVVLCGTLSHLQYMRQRLNSLTKNMLVVSNDDLSSAHGAVYYGLSEKLGIPRTAPICLFDEPSRLAEDSTLNMKDDDYTHIIGIGILALVSLNGIIARLIAMIKLILSDKNLMQLPTLSLYDESLTQQKYWGKEAFDDYYHSGESGKLMSRFKLYLDNIDEHGENEMVIINAISNYLRALNEKINQVMETKFPKTYKKYRYCFTVPTIWNDQMKRVMRDTVTSAGIISKQDSPNRLLLVNEPEAAAIFYANDSNTDYFKSYLKENPQKTKVRTLICDAGGGTVDTATYEYFKKENCSKYFIDEVTAGSGSLCGSSFLDDAFRKFIKHECYVRNYIVSSYELEQIVLNFILAIKEKFTYKSQQDTIINIPIKDAPKIVISSNDMSTKIFDPVVDKILCLIENQYNAMEKVEMKLDMIILTGGLGQSKYLLNKIQDKFSDKGIQVRAPSQYDQSVVRGAVELARDTSCIARRIVQKSYGLEVLHPLVDTVGSPQSTSESRFVKSKFDFLFRANNFMKNNEYVEKKYYIAYPNNTFISILSTSGQNTEIHSSLDPRLEKVLMRNIDLPKSLTLQPGDVVPILVRLYLGQTEVKLDVIIDENIITKKQLFSSITNVKEMQQPQPLPQKSLSSKFIPKKSLSSTTSEKASSGYLKKPNLQLSGILKRLKVQTKP